MGLLMLKGHRVKDQLHWVHWGHLHPGRWD
jgi:hypothetical protein